MTNFASTSLVPEQLYQPTTTSFAAAREQNPGLALTVSWFEDSDYQWDGDCEQPETPAFVCHIQAWKIENGNLVSGSAYLSGCYPLEDDNIDWEVSGYASQMIEEAIAALDEWTV